MKILCLSFLLLAPLHAQTVPSSDAAEVSLDGATVYRVLRPWGSSSAKERAAAVTQRLQALEAWLPQNLILAESDGLTLCLNGSEVLFSTSDADAQAEGVARQALAESRLRAIQEALQKRAWDQRWMPFARSSLWALAALLAMAAGLWASALGFRALDHAIQAGASRLPGAHPIFAGRVTRTMSGGLRWLQAAWRLVLLYLGLSAALGAFASTRALSRSLLDTLVQPLGQAWHALVDSIPNLLFIAVGAALVYAIIKAAHILFNEVGRGRIQVDGFRPEWALPTFKIARFLILVFGVIVLAPYLPGAKSPAFQGVSVFLGVIISLSSSSAISNIISGVILIYAGNLRVGDRVSIGDAHGVVIERSLLVTRLRTPKNLVVTLPNAVVLGGKVENESLRTEAGPRLLYTSVSIGYATPWRKVHQLLLEAASGVDGLLSEPPPFVLQTALDDFYVAYQLNAATDQPQVQERILSDLHGRIQDAFAAAGVEILSPHYRAQRDGGAPALPQA